MIRQAGPDDTAAIAGFLDTHIESSMFLLSNLESLGIGNTEHPHGTAYFLRETGDGITGVFGCTNAGYLLCQLPGLGATEAQTYAHLLKGYTLRGMTGDDAQVATVLAALNLSDDQWAINKAEPLYRLALANLTPVTADLRAPHPGDQELLEQWFAAYMRETGTGIDGQAGERARAAIGADHIRIMTEDGTPVAMAAINARAGSALQIGGVFVPPELRGAGRAGRVVSALLAEKAQGMADTAILFAASEGAAKAYERIGFQKIGAYRVALLKTPYTLGAPA